MSTFCPECRQDVVVTKRGECVWCDTPTIDLADVQVVFPRNGCAPILTDDQLQRAADLYYRRGESLRAIARALHPQTGYKTPAALAGAVSHQFKLHGWPVRDRVQEVKRVRTIHGLARDPEHRHRLRVANGEIRGVLCAGVRLHYPNKGAPCRNPARAGSDWCRFHDPALRGQINDELASTRSSSARFAGGEEAS